MKIAKSRLYDFEKKRHYYEITITKIVVIMENYYYIVVKINYKFKSI